MGLFSNPFKTIASKIKAVFNPRDKALQQAEKSNAINTSMATKYKRTSAHFHFRKHSIDDIKSKIRERLLRKVKKTDLNTTTIGYFGDFRPVRYFRVNGKTLSKRKTIA